MISLGINKYVDSDDSKILHLKILHFNYLIANMTGLFWYY